MRYFALTVVITTLAALSSSVFSIPAGIAASFDVAVIRGAKNLIVPEVIDTLNSMVIPRIDFDGGYVHDVKFAIVQMDPHTF